MAESALTTEELRQRVARLPRIELAHLPTPLEEVPRFADVVGGPRIFIKRDDCTGLLYGGNKTRHNEFLMAEALRRGADVVVWGAGVQSNNCRQTAAACARLGLECRLVLSRSAHRDEIQGNLLLDYLVGAKVEIVDAEIGPELDEVIIKRAEELRGKGRIVYSWDRHEGRPLAAVSYLLCLAEIVDEMQERQLPIDAIYVSSAGATGAGLTLAKAVLGLACPVRLICPIKWPWDTRADMAEIANQVASLLDLPHRLGADDIDATEDYIGPGYGAISEGGMEALDLLARYEGILLDPVYTSKAMAALIDHVRKRQLKAGQNVVFVHTGGTPAVFAYRDELMEAKKGR
ncbi:MAG: 1-aminocyclopropane-1-carboxylate deaminase [Gemmatales bacterium]|nr:MAG: 1-aminocyclopropane-1-carboxylate deaminase [Gemmatales bacterium]